MFFFKKFYKKKSVWRKKQKKKAKKAKVWRKKQNFWRKKATELLEFFKEMEQISWKKTQKFGFGQTFAYV